MYRPTQTTSGRLHLLLPPSPVKQPRRPMGERRENILEATETVASVKAGSRFVQVQVSDEAAKLIADRLKALDLYAEACCVEVLLRDRANVVRAAELFFDELVDKWHAWDIDDQGIASFCGFRDEQYAAWVEGRYADVFTQTTAPQSAPLSNPHAPDGGGV